VNEGFLPRGCGSKARCDARLAWHGLLPESGSKGSVGRTFVCLFVLHTNSNAVFLFQRNLISRLHLYHILFEFYSNKSKRFRLHFVSELKHCHSTATGL